MTVRHAAIAVVSALWFAACGGTVRTTDGDGDDTGGKSSTGGKASGAITGAGGFDTATGGSTNAGAEPGTGAGGSTGSTSVSAADFDQSCQYDTDCQLVIDGDQCGCQTCDRRTVSSEDASAFEKAAERARSLCPPSDVACSHRVCDRSAVAACDQTGRCRVRSQLDIHQDDFPRTCASDFDCVAIAEMEVCSPCKCATGAVNVAGYVQYEDLLSKQGCAPSPTSCHCPAQYLAHCNPVDGGQSICTLEAHP